MNYHFLNSENKDSYFDARDPNLMCRFCGALMWHDGRSRKNIKLGNLYFMLCRQEGRINLPKFWERPFLLWDLCSYEGGKKSKHYRDNIRAYNSMFAFTSMGAKVDQTINQTLGPYIFKIRGQNYHRIESLITEDGQSPKFRQLYFSEATREVENRLRVMSSLNLESHLDPNIVDDLKAMLNEMNPLVQHLRTARKRRNDHMDKSFRLQLLSARQAAEKEYKEPSSAEIAALIVGDYGKTSGHCDIIIQDHTTSYKRVSKLHPRFMALQYLLLVPFTEEGFHTNLLYRAQFGATSRARKAMTMCEYYAYILMQRPSEYNMLLRCRRLLQQYIVDAFLAIEEGRLQWVRNNQQVLKTKLYSNLCDAASSNETQAEKIGRMFIFPSSYQGSYRNRLQNYQDAMAICRELGNPTLFITFTANPKWPKIQKNACTHPQTATRG